MSELLRDFPEIRKLVFSDITKNTIPYEFAIFEYVDGQTLRSIVENGTMKDEHLVAISDQIFDLVSRITQIKTKAPVK